MATAIDYSRGILDGFGHRHQTLDEVRRCYGIPAYGAGTVTGHQVTPVPPVPAVRPYAAPYGHQAAVPVVSPTSPTSPAHAGREPRERFDDLQVPVGRYAVLNREGELKFVIVKESKKWPKYRNVYYQASDTEYYVRDRNMKVSILRSILDQGIDVCTLRYGVNIGVCGVCGKTLTDEISRAIGIGPVCREKKGWI